MDWKIPPQPKLVLSRKQAQEWLYQGWLCVSYDKRTGVIKEKHRSIEYCERALNGRYRGQPYGCAELGLVE